MRIAVISDIHGNCAGLDAVLADLRRYPADQVVCLGDAVQGGAQPAETVARLRELGCPVVMGNADAWLLTGQATGTEPVTEKQLAVREWSLAQLSGEDIEFIGGFKPTIEIELDAGRSLLCFHGSPQSFDDIILPETPEEEFRRLLGGRDDFGFWILDFALEDRGKSKTQNPKSKIVMTGGHTHLQQVRRIDDSFFFNPGSVGVAYDRHLPEEKFHLDPWAEYAVLSCDAERLSLEFCRVPYDINELVRIILSSGRPHAEEFAVQYHIEC
jgi:predicted phosphodiesterase